MKLRTALDAGISGSIQVGRPRGQIPTERVEIQVVPPMAFTFMAKCQSSHPCWKTPSKGSHAASMGADTRMQLPGMRSTRSATPDGST